MFDEARKVIGLKPTDPRRPNAFPVKPKTDSHHRTIHAGSFLTHFRIRPENTVLFQEVEIDNEGIMELDLAKAINVGRRSLRAKYELQTG